MIRTLPPRWLLFFPLLLSGLVASLPDSARGEAPATESDEFFKTGKILELKVDIEGKELDSIRREPRKYVKGTLKEGDKIVFKDVGIHLKGAAGSFRGIDDKPNLTLNMDKFV